MQLPPEWAKEGADVVDEQVGLFHRGEMTAAVELAPVDDVIVPFGQAPYGQHGVAWEDGDPGGYG